MMVDVKALENRIWTMFNTWHLPTSQIDRELCLVPGTAMRYVKTRWKGMQPRWER